MTERVDVTVDGVRLACRVAGDPGSPPMVLLHALGEDGSDWDDVTAELAPTYRTIAVDLRGHGASDWPGSYSFGLMAHDVAGLLDQLGIERCTLFGHSMGGTVAYLLAEDQPARFDRLVLEDTCPPYDRVRPVPERPDGPLPFDWAALEAIYTEVGVESVAMWRRLADVTARTLLVAGGPQSHLPQERLAEVAERIPDCTLVTIDAGHHVHRGAPEEFRAAVRGFLDA